MQNVDARVAWRPGFYTTGYKHPFALPHCGRVTQICVSNTVKLGTSASSP